MPGNAPVFSSENMACEAQVRAELGQRLREVYKAEQSLPERLAALVSRIGQLLNAISNKLAWPISALELADA